MTQIYEKTTETASDGNKVTVVFKTAEEADKFQDWLMVVREEVE